ncbi:helix-turn-helix transcriptional regulator [Natrinema gelatinilyticum]|uniref:helix-turn-helix transcriptional regulator n=1 Tax=Natrinema gelatinilyticum TaxID=2961571 RepID=UPI0020C54FDC|nr:MarR family transcriptional regulator [Natrinema gelatinilyticum]
MGSVSPISPLNDIEFLARSEHRVTALAALARRPQSRTDLRVMTGVSQSTIGRTLREFEERRWIIREGAHYEATPLGSYLATGMREFVDRVEVEQLLRDIWHLLPDAESGFTVDMCAEATITIGDVADPYRPIDRFLDLLGETTELRFAGFDIALIAPCKSELCQRIIDGMCTEIIGPPSVVNHIRSSYPKEFEETLASGNLTVRVHDSLPHYGIGIFDGRIAISGYNPNRGTVEALLDTDSTEACEWAESVYRSYRREVPTIAIESNAK